MMLKTNPYAVDLRCHNVQPGTFGHECEKPATWLGVSRWGYRSMFCQACKDRLGNVVPEWHRADILITKEVALAEARAVLAAAVEAGQDYLEAEARIAQLYNVDPYYLRAVYDGDMTPDGKPAGRALG